MSTEIPKVGAIVTLVCGVIGVVLFLVFNSYFGGPTPISGLVGGDPYEARASFRDAQGLVPKSLVLVRGVKVGEVATVDIEGRRADIKFTLEDRYAPVYRDARVRLGRRTVFGEAFVDLRPGSRSAGELAKGRTVRTRPTVTIDEALELLNDKRRAHFNSMLDTVARGARSPATSQRISSTLLGLQRLVGGVRRLTAELNGQESQIAELVEGSRATLGALGEREQSLRRIVGAGRVTLEAISSRQAALGRALVETPRLLSAADRTLEHSRPLLVESRGIVRDLTGAAPDLAAATHDLRPFARDARRVVSRLGPLRRAAVPALRDALPAVRALGSVAPKLVPAVRNLVPVAQYLSPRAKDIAAFFANTGAATRNGDAGGRWLRLFLFFDDRQAAGAPPGASCGPGQEPAAAGFCSNAYPEPNDTLDNKPFERHPRLVPFKPKPKPKP